MNHSNVMSDTSPHIRHQVQASDGKQMEVVYNNRQPVSDPRYAPEPLHVCFNCAGELVYPLDWVEEGARHWRIALRCPECEARREGVFEQTVVEQLDDELDRATSALLNDLKRITHANMADEIEFFVRALAADVIVPSDFDRHHPAC